MSQDVNVSEKKNGPFSVLWDEIRNYFSSFKSIGKNPVQLIPAIVLAIVWFLATLLPACGVNPGVIKTLGFLSFAEAGMSNSIVKIIGGVIGKGMFATAVYALIGMFSSRAAYLRILFITERILLTVFGARPDCPLFPFVKRKPLYAIISLLRIVYAALFPNFGSK